jgi:hypothetical protein
MHVKRRRLPNFEACSVALFASLAMGAAVLPSRTQLPTAPTRLLSSTAPAATAGRTTPRIKPRSNAPEAQDAAPDGSVSSPGFDESLK